MEKQTYEAIAYRTKLETLSRCGSGIQGEGVFEVVGGLAIGNSTETLKAWSNIALLFASHRQTSSDDIYEISLHVIPEIIERMRVRTAFKAKKRKDVLLGIVCREIGMLALDCKRGNDSEAIAEAAKISLCDYLEIEEEVKAIIFDRVENAANRIRQEGPGWWY